MEAKVNRKLRAILNILVVSMIASEVTAVDEISEYGSCMTISPVQTSILTDNTLDAVYTVAKVTAPAVQSIIFDWTACTTTDDLIEGVFIHTDESQMNSGTMNFYVGGQKCTDTSGVGVNAIGGVFNCGLSGRTFEARCDIECSDRMAVVEIKLWKQKIMNVYGTPYIFDGNVARVPSFSDIDYVWGVGSYYSPT